MNLYTFSRTVAVTLLAAAVGIAQEAPQAPHLPTLAWQKFQAEQKAPDRGPWTAVWNKATGTPKAIFGPGLQLAGPVRSLEAAREQAGTTLTRFADLLGSGTSRFIERIAVKANQVNILVYDQQFKGLPVISGRADVRINDIGCVAMFGASAIEIPATFNTVPVLGSAAAAAIAHARILGGPAANQLVPTLVVWADAEASAPTTATLAWEVQIEEMAGDQVSVGKAYVDAVGGGFLQWINEVYTCNSCNKPHVSRSRSHPRHTARLEHASRVAARLSDTALRPATSATPPVALTGTVMAWVNRGLRPTDALTNVPLANLRLTSPAGNAVTDSLGNFSIPYTGTAPVTVTATLAGLHSQRIRVAQGTQMSAATPITPGTPGTIQFGLPTMGIFDRAQTTTYWYTDDVNTWLRGLLPSATTEMNRISGMNPRVNINSSCNAYYTSFTINFYHESSSCNMTAYSTVIYHEWGHGLDDAFGGISQTEGLSEGWGDIIGLYRTDQPVLGAFFTKSGGSIRSGLNTRTYPVGGTSVHAQGETWMGFAWDLRTDLRTRFGTAQAIAISENIVVRSIAADATNQPDAVREVFILDDNDGNLNNGTPHYDSLETAALKRTLPYPKVQLGTLTHSALQSTEEQLVPRIVRAIATPLQGTFTKVEVFYKTGTAFVAREMVSTGTKDEYIALLPGQLSPASMAYYIVATHSTAKQFRYPETGELNYAVGQESQIFFDNFDGVNTGWTHGANATQDDWQMGPPTGKSGTSNSVAWTDPSAAFSGSNCWGNDLGIGNFNGAYQGNVDNYLRSPALNTTGKVGVTLKFKRWLTVEESQFDRATINVNGVNAWTNPAVGHVLDKSWTDFELKIPQADNKASVTLEWRLQSDGGMHLGGWAIDDVRVFTFASLPPPAVQLTVVPAQIGLGQQGTLTIKGTANAPALVLVALNKGPLTIPGLPTLFVDGSFQALPVVLDGAGQLSGIVKVPNLPAVTGQMTYAQVLELTNPTTVSGSNGAIVLFGK